VRGPPIRHPDDSREQLPAVEGVILDPDTLKTGDRVVYPNQGVCVVTGVEEKDIAGQKLQLVRMSREEDGAAVMVPRNKVASIGLRRVATGDQMEGVFHYLAAQFDDPELDWKVRHRDNADRLIAGGVLGVAEVVKGLHALSRIRPLPAKEREQYDNARHLLVHEVAVSLSVPPGVAEDFIDYALMPPAGVKFDLKPPPAPVMLPSRPKRRKPAAEEEGEIGDLGLGDLGLDIDLGAALEGEAAEAPEGGAEGGASAEAGEGAEEGGEAAAEGAGAAAEGAGASEADEAAEPPAGEDDEAEAAQPRPRAGRAKKPAAEKAEKAPRKAAARKAEKPEKPDKAEKPRKPAKKPAAEKPEKARGAAAKRGGKKK
jgi:RNA polymerase-interacting CarD/CdnL/TRCF family regulator